MRAIAYGLAFLLSASAAQALELKPLEAHKIEMNGVNGVAYYTWDGEDCRVVAVLAAGESGTPVRFSTTLEPGQHVTVAVPGGDGENASAVEFVREGDSVAVAPALLALN
jgi:hypothetical protein